MKLYTGVYNILLKLKGRISPILYKGPSFLFNVKKWETFCDFLKLHFLPSKRPSSTCIETFRQINGILNEISLLKKCMKEFSFSNSLLARIVSM